MALKAHERFKQLMEHLTDVVLKVAGQPMMIDRLEDGNSDRDGEQEEGEEEQEVEEANEEDEDLGSLFIPSEGSIWSEVEGNVPLPAIPLEKFDTIGMPIPLPRLITIWRWNLCATFDLARNRHEIVCRKIFSRLQVIKVNLFHGRRL